MRVHQACSATKRVCPEHESSSRAMRQFPTSLLGTRRGRQIASAAAASFLCAWLPARGFALDPARNVFQYNCRSWSRQNGLPANTVNAIAQTKDGYIWLGKIGRASCRERVYISV